VLTSITLQNFKSFGEAQTIPLQPITVLVGPNNSGKSNLVSLARFIRNAATGGAEAAFEGEGGVEFVFHRPLPEDARLRIAWTVAATGTYTTELARGGEWPGAHGTLEQIETVAPGGSLTVPAGEAFKQLGELFNTKRGAEATPLRAVCAPMVGSSEVKLSAQALRQDAGVIPDPRPGADGSGIAAVLGLWRGAKLERAEELDRFMRGCLPEIDRILVKPGEVAGEQRLWVRQTDGEEFDAAHVSDGVLSFIALAMHAIDAEPGALLFIEEPEQSIHPRRLHDLVELFRTIVHERRCQIVIVTHSPVLLHEFKDEPEAILLFRRDEQKGTRVNRLTEFPDLLEALRTREADPGDMLTNGFLNEPS
jgi:predicted ATPase